MIKPSVMIVFCTVLFLTAGWPVPGTAAEKPAPATAAAVAQIPDILRRLKKAPDPETAAVLAAAARTLWRRSGSDTVDLLLRNVGVLVRDGDHDRALEILDAVVEIAPEFAGGWLQRAAVLYRLRKYGVALHDVSLALQLEPDHFDALGQLGLILDALGDRKGALKAFERALRIYPYMPGIGTFIDRYRARSGGKPI